MLNLAINARDAMGGGGRLTIEVGNAVLDDDYAPTPRSLPGDYVVLAVSDTGARHARRDPRSGSSSRSSRPRRPARAPASGLSMVYGFVKQSGGHVKIYSEPGQGATVRLYLPRTDRPGGRSGGGGAGPVTGGAETILVAEDDEQVRATVVAMLRDLGYRVLTAKDAASALDIVEGGAAIDLLFTDVVMPGKLRSTELARLVRARRRASPCCSPRATPRTRSSTTDGSTPASSCCPSPTPASRWPGSCVRCSPGRRPATGSGRRRRASCCARTTR